MFFFLLERERYLFLLYLMDNMTILCFNFIGCSFNLNAFLPYLPFIPVFSKAEAGLSLLGSSLLSWWPFSCVSLKYAVVVCSKFISQKPLAAKAQSGKLAVVSFWHPPLHYRTFKWKRCSLSRVASNFWVGHTSPSQPQILVNETAAQILLLVNFTYTSSVYFTFNQVALMWRLSGKTPVFTG